MPDIEEYIGHKIPMVQMDSSLLVEPRPPIFEERKKGPPRGKKKSHKSRSERSSSGKPRHSTPRSGDGKPKQQRPRKKTAGKKKTSQNRKPREDKPKQQNQQKQPAEGFLNKVMGFFK
jgi:hypothetical protein